jgi:hypothetical protein
VSVPPQALRDDYFPEPPLACRPEDMPTWPSLHEAPRGAKKRASSADVEDNREKVRVTLVRQESTVGGTVGPWYGRRETPGTQEAEEGMGPARAERCARGASLRAAPDVAFVRRLSSTRTRVSTVRSRSGARWAPRGAGQVVGFG